MTRSDLGSGTQPKLRDSSSGVCRDNNPDHFWQHHGQCYLPVPVVKAFLKLGKVLAWYGVELLVS